MLKIIVDAMGGDHAPQEIVKGAIDALKVRKDFALVLTGDKQAVEAELNKYDYDKGRVELVPCSEVVTNDDSPTVAIRTKKDSSLVVGMKRLKEDEEAAGFVSAEW